jgi:hypothetical protein
MYVKRCGVFSLGCFGTLVTVCFLPRPPLPSPCPLNLIFTSQYSFFCFREYYHSETFERVGPDVTAFVADSDDEIDVDAWTINQNTVFGVNVPSRREMSIKPPKSSNKMHIFHFIILL